MSGFLIGNCIHAYCLVPLKTDSYITIYFNQELKLWAIMDITLLVKPEVYSNKSSYFGLWKGMSTDKKSKNRFEIKKDFIRHLDEVKISETVIQFDLKD